MSEALNLGVEVPRNMRVVSMNEGRDVCDPETNLSLNVWTDVIRSLKLFRRRWSLKHLEFLMMCLYLIFSSPIGLEVLRTPWLVPTCRMRDSLIPSPIFQPAPWCHSASTRNAFESRLWSKESDCVSNRPLPILWCCSTSSGCTILKQVWHLEPIAIHDIKVRWSKDRRRGSSTESTPVPAENCSFLHPTSLQGHRSKCSKVTSKLCRTDTDSDWIEQFDHRSWQNGLAEVSLDILAGNKRRTWSSRFRKACWRVLQLSTSLCPYGWCLIWQRWNCWRKVAKSWAMMHVLWRAA